MRYFFRPGDIVSRYYIVLLLLCFLGSILGSLLFIPLVPRGSIVTYISDISLLKSVISCLFSFLVILFFYRSFYSLLVTPLIFLFRGFFSALSFESVLYTGDRALLYRMLLQDLPGLFLLLFAGGLFGAYSIKNVLMQGKGSFPFS